MMNLRENELVGINANQIFPALDDLEIEVTYIDEDDDGLIRIETAIGYTMEFKNDICYWSGYEKEE